MSLYYFVNGQISLVLMIVVLLHGSLSSFLLLVLFYGNSLGYLVFFLMHEVDIRDKINAYPKTKGIKDDRMTEKKYMWQTQISSSESIANPILLGFLRLSLVELDPLK